MYDDRFRYKRQDHPQSVADSAGGNRDPYFLGSGLAKRSGCPVSRCSCRQDIVDKQNPATKKRSSCDESR
jgi:hypothetical protein